MASVPDLSLEAGLTALRDGDYQRAIAHFEAICDQPHQTPADVKAQMGLIVAYEHTGEINRALALCQSLSNSTNPQTRKWAERKQAELKNRYSATETTNSPSTKTDVTGFVAFDRGQEIRGQGDKETRGQGESEVRSQEIRGQGDKGTRGQGDKETRRQGDKETRGQGESEVRSQEIRGRGDKEIEVLLFQSLPAAPAPPTSPAPSAPFQWRQAGRAKRWQPLSPVNLIPFWLLQFGTAVLLFWLIRELLKFAMASTNAVLVKLPYLEPIQLFYRDSTLFVLLILSILVVVSPWLLDRVLRLCCGLQPLSRDTLSGYSPEAIRVLQRYCRQRRWSLPGLGVLPTSVPMALTYGNLPRTARIVVSQGLLDQLADDEIAIVYAGQLGHITYWDFVLMSLVILITGLPYIIYYQVAQWGDRRSNAILSSIAAVIASLAYGVWWLLSATAGWLSQLRIYYSDRLAVEITGNPNALSRALLKISQGVTLDIQQRGHTSWLLESLNLMTLVGYRQAIILGNHSYSEIERILAWDCFNLGRYWLNINNTHPLIGDRLQRLNSIAQQWHLQTELNLVRRQKSGVKIFNSSSSPISSVFTRSFLLQAAPFFGIALGFAFGCLTWLIGGISILFQFAQLASLYGDWVIIRGCLPIGFSIGTFIRINSFFPDIKTATVQTNPSLSDLLANPHALPVDSQPVRFQGKLLGRRGISNFLGQDLILQSAQGLIKLHHCSWLGAIDILSQSPSPRDLVGENVVVTGWFRRGATSWLDIDSWRSPSGKISRSAHPIWSTLLASVAAVWGAYIILSSGE